MSSAFVKDTDDLWLRDIAPTMDALIDYLTHENGGLRITEKKNYYNEKVKTEVFKMSNGFEYMIKDNKWVELD
ncbi:MAG: hypothetical protein JWO32_1305 [Bacteroidetes bacterium]|nr:hypothetical protein [Bacteroidota bacterium]